MWKHFVTNKKRAPDVFGTKEFQLEIRPSLDEKAAESNKRLFAWEIAPYCSEHWDGFPSAAAAIAAQLLLPLTVITTVSAFPNPKPRKPYYSMFTSEEEFLQTYSKILLLHGLDDNTFFQAPGNLITRTQGLDLPLSTLLFSGDYGELFDYTAYGFPALPAAHDFVQAKAAIEKTPYVLQIRYERTPDLLHICAGRGGMSPAQCLETIQDICKAHTLSLEIDPELIQCSL